MNARPHWLKSRSKSVPASYDYIRIRRGDFTRFVDKAVELRMKAKKDAIRRESLGKCQARHSIPHCLMPRLGIVDDKSQSRIIAQLEIPDVNPHMVQLRLQGDKLTVVGERQPHLSSVPAEYHDGLLRHSQAIIGGDQRPRLIMLRGGHVSSFSVPLQPPPSRQSHSAEGDAQAGSTNSSEPISIMYYNELRYGPFRRDLRVPPATKAADIQALFHNGMLLISWPRTASGTTETHNAESPGVIIPIAPDPHGAPVTVKVESMEE
ncbi:hypothetical protein LshimejAT787_0703690 [Lyophyllum shimeji]|uniref:SHSP domain-containing protein n=1 Tax=Lyophyllum shimeji TaxID=47721 RepID=A0A9P3PQR2_LYOSH|nr:hypothetical protein LshimejAT787_0703690 [Lyophyllum shimeji]